MPAPGQVIVEFNDDAFDRILNDAGVRAMCRGAAEKALAYARQHAPVGDPTDPIYKRPERRPGQYRDGLQIKTVQHAHRLTYMVVGTDSKTLLVESQTGNLQKALKAAKI